ncbi:Helitron helicase-like protein [Phytophthora palmivora]|uniref:ATP-dependent DNA helicase n=1 Tax=Phytophthora palmivora TaxID=4796 RepID=A0A2P4Y1B9_9STRA|nr:Helitron helicase-like protein [Phytophthora palmivora]
MGEYKTLKYLARYLASNGKLLDTYGLPVHESNNDVSFEWTARRRRRTYSYRQTEFEHVVEQVHGFNHTQRGIFDQVIQAILAHVRLQGEIAVAVASSGIVATLLKPYNTFDFPYPSQANIAFDMQPFVDEPKIRSDLTHQVDNLGRGTDDALGAVDRTFRDIMKNEEPFGGKVEVFSGDHREFLPVLKNSTQAEMIAACFNSSPSWEHLRQVRLTEHMCARTAPSPVSAVELAEFSVILFQIGEGRYPVNQDISENDICLPRDMCVFPKPCEAIPVVQNHKDDDNDMETPPNFDLLSGMKSLAGDSEEIEDDRRARNIHALIDVHLPTQDQQYDLGRLTGNTKEYLSIDSLEEVAGPNMFEQSS